MLGDKITATIKSKYYFGAPVVNAKVHYKVMRQSHSAEWYPQAKWDWFYEPGYWWFGYDYNWYPGFREWGMRMRLSGPGGAADLSSRKSSRKMMCRSVLTATSRWRSTPLRPRPFMAIRITNTRSPLRSPINPAAPLSAPGMCSWRASLSRFMPGWIAAISPRETWFEAQFSAQTLDNKPVAKAKGELKLLKITYGADGKPVETQVQRWDLADQ